MLICYHQYIIQKLFDFADSSTLKKVFEHFLLSSSHLMLARDLAPFACLFSN